MNTPFFNNIPFTGGGGGDLNNKGWFVTPLALRTAYPTGQDGWHAIVGSTDTVWVWDTDTNDWVDTNKAESVTSVFGRTGDIEAEAGDYNASQVDYDNSTSGLTAENVQDAIDEVIALNKPIEVLNSLLSEEIKNIPLLTKTLIKDFFVFDVVVTDGVLTNTIHGNILHKNTAENGKITQEDYYFSDGDSNYTELVSINAETILIGGIMHLTFTNNTTNPLTLTININ